MMVAGGMAYAAGRRTGAYEEDAAYAEPAAAPPPTYQEVPPAPPPPAPTQAPSEMDGEMDQLQKLADLHASGVLSDEEFTAAKDKLLGIGGPAPAAGS
jgi:hypothetical protein